MIKIPLTQGKYAVADNEDTWLLQYSWCYDAFEDRAVGYVNGKTVYMHRIIMNASSGMQVDHINHDRLDNRRSNLRLVTNQQNQWNRGKEIGNTTSKYKGVCWHKASSKWIAKISHMGKTINIGIYTSETDAANAYNEYASQLFGEYACLNVLL